MIISVGGGMDTSELELRKKFIAKIKEIVAKRGMYVKFDLSKLNDQVYEALFGDPAAGMVDALILEKKD